VDVGFPMQTVSGEIIFSVGQHALTADQLLELLERDELNAEGVRRLVEASATPMHSFVADRMWRKIGRKDVV
jgi:hypothetical protein